MMRIATGINTAMRKTMTLVNMMYVLLMLKTYSKECHESYSH